MRHRGVADATSVLPHRGRAPVGPGAAPRPAAVVVRAWILTTCQWRTQDARAHRTGDPRQPGLDPSAPNHGYRRGPHAPVTPFEPMNRHFQRAPGATERIFALTDVKLQVSKCRPRARGGVPYHLATIQHRLPSSPRTRGCSRREQVHARWLDVVPAHAGVFRCWRTRRGYWTGRPRARGGVPRFRWPHPRVGRSSPRTRGCSAPEGAHTGDRPVVPAHAGVFPTGQSGARGCAGRPRARGGVPRRKAAAKQVEESSPRTRGCSRRTCGRRGSGNVVPAHAGVFRSRSPCGPQCGGRPRARGGVPTEWLVWDGRWVSSPRTRGCSEMTSYAASAVLVVPAHAGVFRTAPDGTPSLTCRPRARGGVPVPSGSRVSCARSSPRTRGCSQREDRRSVGGQVVPAHAGVFRCTATSCSPSPGRPRARGGVPAVSTSPAGPSKSSPRTRGCSLRRPCGRDACRVVPAHAGVFRPERVRAWFPVGRPRARGGVPRTGCR